MKKRFQNIPIRCWKNESSNIRTREPSLSLSGTDEPAKILMDALAETINDPTPSQRKVTFIGTEPEDYKGLRFRKIQANDEIKNLWIGIEDGQPVVEFTDNGIEEVKRVFDLWIDGVEDFQMYPEGKSKDLGEKEKNSGEIWFWRTMLP